MSTRLHVAIRHLAMVAALGAVIDWLWHVDRVPFDGSAMPVDGQGVTTFAIALMRAVALVFAMYLVVLVIVSAVVRALELPRTTRVVDRLTVPVLRTLLGGAATLGVITGPPAPPAVPAPTSVTVAQGPAPTSDDQATLHLLDPGAPVAPSPPSSPDDTWIVEPGESFWLIARSRVAESQATEVDDGTIEAYWVRLIDANRDRLADPADADLLFAGQELVLPPVGDG
jgi:hypothetical protein